MILTGRPVPAAEAKTIGLANRVVPRGASTHAALDLAASLVAFPQVALTNGAYQSIPAAAGSFLVHAVGRLE